MNGGNISCLASVFAREIYVLKSQINRYWNNNYSPSVWVITYTLITNAGMEEIYPVLLIITQ